MSGPGIGQEFMEAIKPESSRSGIMQTGLGRYALGPEAKVHWTEVGPPRHCPACHRTDLFWMDAADAIYVTAPSLTTTAAAATVQ